MPLRPDGVATLAHAGHASGPAAVSWLLVTALTGALVVVYRLGVRERARRLVRPWPRWRTASFALGAMLVGTGLSPAVDQLARAGPSGHMVQHLLLGMFAPLLLVLGAPVTVALGAIPVAWRRPARAVLTSRAVHVVTHPISAASLHVGGMLVLYLTPLYLLSAQQPIIHHLVHAHFLLAGYLFAWSIAGPDPAPRRAGFPMRLAVLVAASGAHAFLAKLLYARAGELPPGTDLGVVEMEQAAQVMYYGGDVAEFGIAVVLFASWYAGRTATRAPGHASGTAPAPFDALPGEAQPRTISPPTGARISPL